MLKRNCYYYPEDNGLEVFDEVETGEYCNFDTTVVWRHKETGKLYWAHDSGCSCPTPFECYTSIRDLNELTEDTLYNFTQHLVNQRYITQTDINECMNKVKSYLKK